MIRLGLRLTLKGGKEAAIRLGVTSCAVGLGIGLLLTILAGINGLNAQAARAAWLTTSRHNIQPSVNRSPAGSLWWLVNVDQFENMTIDRVDVAATGRHSPVPPGIRILPRPGQFYASPALSRLLRSTPASELADRLGATQIGIIGPSAIPSPDTLIAVVGKSPHKLSQTHGAEKVTSFETATGQSGPGGYSSLDIEILLAVGACALVFPVLIFISAATRLAATRREQRFAAMRLAGAVPRQISVISAVESTVAALIGLAIGFVLFSLLRQTAATVPFTGQPSFPGDLALSRGDVLLVAVGIPLAAMIAARISLRRVHISPLGVTRRVTPSAPRGYRILPLFAGLGLLTWLAFTEQANGNFKRTVPAFTLGFILTMIGLVMSGAWLTVMGSRIIATRTSRPAPLIAARRLADNPRGAFRAISGLVLALFVTTVTLGTITTIVSSLNNHGGRGADGSTLVEQFYIYTTSGVATSLRPAPTHMLIKLRSMPGVTGVSVIHVDARPTHITTGHGGPTGFVSCEQLSRTPALGRCALGARVATIAPNFVQLEKIRQIMARVTQSGTVWPAAPISLARLSGLPVLAIYVGTNGTSAAIERARTVLEVRYPFFGTPLTIGELSPAISQGLAVARNVAEVVIMVSLAIAGCSLAVTTAGGLIDRKRNFSLLRLTGVPLGILRRIVGLEIAVPLIGGAVVAVGAGLFAAELLLRAALHVSLLAPDPSFYALVLAGLAVSLSVIATTLPLLERITGPEVARND